MKNNIRELRKKHGMTMTKLAELIDTSQQQIDRLEKGKRKLSAEWIDVLCKALQCKPMELIDFSVNDSAPINTNSTSHAKVLGAIETKFGNNIREFGIDEKYEVRFKPAAKDADKDFFALVVEGGNYLSYPDGTELILINEAQSQAQAGLQENAESFTANLKNAVGVHRFVIGNTIMSGRVIKSIRSE